MAALMCAGAAGAESVQFDLSAAANKDIVMEKGPGATAESFGTNPDGGDYFVEEGYADEVATARGLPPDRRIKSTQPGLGTYKLLPYNKPNVIELASRAEAKAQNQFIKVPQKKYQQLGMLVSSVDGDSSFTIKLRYTDGIEQVHWFEADDWYETDVTLRPSQHVALGGMDRARQGRIDKAGHYSIFEFLVPADPSKTLESIMIGNDPNRWPGDTDRWGAVFAINGETAK
jgi:hypothetical protein